MRISDWSSDVCFSDLRDQWHTMTKTGKVNKLKQHISRPFVEIHPEDAVSRNIGDGDVVMIRSRRGQVRDRKSVVEGKSVSVRVDLGGRRVIKKKKDTKTVWRQQTDINQQKTTV